MACKYITKELTQSVIVCGCLSSLLVAQCINLVIVNQIGTILIGAENKETKMCGPYLAKANQTQFTLIQQYIISLTGCGSSASYLKYAGLHLQSPHHFA
jgi:fructoselysine-6-P-deglycase FrlB-like protein